MKTIALVLTVLLSSAGGGFTKEDWFSLWKKGGGGEWICLVRTDVREDLALPKETLDKIDEMVKTFLDERKTIHGKPEGELDQAIRKHKANYEEKAKKLIGEEKYKRLNEIYMQMHGNGMIGEAKYQKLLGLTSSQISDVSAANDTYNQRLSYLLYQIQDENLPLKDVEKELDNMEMMLSSDCARIYTKEQAKKVEELRGKRFAMKESPLWWRMVSR